MDFASIFDGAFGAILGVIVGALVSCRVAKFTARQQQYYIAAGNFRAEFVDELICLRKKQQDAYKILTNKVIIRHKRAKVIFECHLSQSSLNGFNEAWKEYEEYALWFATKNPGSLDNRPDDCDKGIQKIESLLAFANITRRKKLCR